jgi:Flp pilus assembly protein TadD
VKVRVLASQGDKEGALTELERVIGGSPKAAGARLLKAELFAAFGRPMTDVRDAFQAVLEVDAGNLSALGALVGIQLNLQQPDAARTVFRKMQQEHPKQALTIYNGVLIESQAGDLGKAYEHHRRC